MNQFYPPQTRRQRRREFIRPAINSCRIVGSVALAVACLTVAPLRADVVEPLFHLGFDDGFALSNMGSGAATATLAGTAANVSFVDGLLGKAIDLGNTQGTSSGGQYVSVGQTVPDVGTISTWYHAKPWYNYQTVFHNSVNPDRWETWIYSSGVLKSRMAGGTGDVQYDLDNLNPPNGANNWYHIAYAWDKNDATATAAQLYVNGQLRASDDIPSWIAPGTLSLAGGSGGNTYGAGLFDEFKMYDVKLDADQVAYEYNSVPVVQWKMNGNLTNSGSGGAQYDGTLVDGVNGTNAYVQGKFGQALDLDNPAPGSPAVRTDGDYVSVDYTLADEGTIALWYQPEAFYNYQTIFDNSASGDYWEFWVYNTGVARFRVNNDAGVDYDLDNLGGPNDWYHMAVTWDRDDTDDTKVDIQLFVDGILRDTATSTWRDPGTQFFLAGGSNGNTYGNGIWDDVRIFERALSADEINYMATIPEPATLTLLALGCLGLAACRRRRRG